MDNSHYMCFLSHQLKDISTNKIYIYFFFTVTCTKKLWEIRFEFCQENSFNLRLIGSETQLPCKGFISCQYISPSD